MHKEELELPCEMYTSEQIYQAEQDYLATGELTNFELIELAGNAAFRLLSKRHSKDVPILVLAGYGNNGADAFICASKLIESGYLVSLMAVSRTEAEQASRLDFTRCRDAYICRGGIVEEPDLERIGAAEVIVDGLLGTGVKGEVRETIRHIIDTVNKSKAWVLSIDVPSGIIPDTGYSACAIEADMTITFGALKQGLMTGHARHCCGKIMLASLGMSPFLPATGVTQVTDKFVRARIIPRARDSHKGLSGKVTVIGGDNGMAGAVRLAGEACLRAGAGLVNVISRPEHQNTVNANRPELMFWGCELVDMEVYLRLGWAHTLVIGPGLGKQTWGYNLLKAVALSDKPCVLDADALNLLSEEPRSQGNWILTPHSGEAARLLACSIENVEKDRFKAAQDIQAKYGGIVVLKGPGTLITDGKQCVVAPVGNPGLASGGCGDVLSGVIGALLSQNHSLLDAAVMGVVIHGTAADRAALQGERGMLASDLMPHIRSLVNNI